MYYVEDSPITSDATFDEVVKRLGEQWDDIEHPHKHLLDRSLLKSAYYIEEYPLMVQGAANSMREKFTMKGTTKRGQATRLRH